MGPIPGTTRNPIATVRDPRRSRERAHAEEIINANCGRADSRSHGREIKAPIDEIRPPRTIAIPRSKCEIWDGSHGDVGFPIEIPRRQGRNQAPHRLRRRARTIELHLWPPSHAIIPNSMGSVEYRSRPTEHFRPQMTRRNHAVVDQKMPLLDARARELSVFVRDSAPDPSIPQPPPYLMSASK